MRMDKNIQRLFYSRCILHHPPYGGEIMNYVHTKESAAENFIPFSVQYQVKDKNS